MPPRSTKAPKSTIEEVLDATEVDEGGGQEAAQTDVEDKAALDDLDDLALDVLASVELLLDAVPSTLVLGALLGEDQTAVLVLLLENEGLNGVAQVHDVSGVGVLADGQLADGNNALRLEADVKQDLIALNLDNGTRDKITLVEIGNGTVDEVVHLLVGHVIQRENGRVLNLTQRWTPFENGAPMLMRIACSSSGPDARPQPPAWIYIARGPTDMVCERPTHMS